MVWLIKSCIRLNCPIKIHIFHRDIIGMSDSENEHEFCGYLEHKMIRDFRLTNTFLVCSRNIYQHAVFRYALQEKKSHFYYYNCYIDSIH